MYTLLAFPPAALVVNEPRVLLSRYCYLGKSTALVPLPLPCPSLLRSLAQAKLRIQRPQLRQKMPFVDQWNELRGKTVNLVFGYNIMPKAGKPCCWPLGCSSLHCCCCCAASAVAAMGIAE